MKKNSEKSAYCNIARTIRMICYTSQNRLERPVSAPPYARTATHGCSLFCRMTTTRDRQTDRRTDLLVLTCYGFPIQRLVWFLFTKFVSCSFLVVVGHFFSIPFSKQEWPNLFFYRTHRGHFRTCQQYDVPRVIVTFDWNINRYSVTIWEINFKTIIMQMCQH